MYVFYVAPTFLSYSAIPFLFLELDSGNVAENISQWHFLLLELDTYFSLPVCRYPRML